MNHLSLRPLLIALSLSAAALSHAEDPVRIYDTTRESETLHYRTIQLSAPQCAFTIHSVQGKNPDDVAGDPHAAAVSINKLGSGPTLAFNVLGPGFTIARAPYSLVQLKGKPDQKGVRARWDLPGGIVTMSTAIDDEEPFLYGRLQVERNEASQIILLLAPGGHASEPKDRDRWVYSESGDVQHSASPVELASHWLFLYDKLLDPALTPAGKGAVGFLWSDSSESKVTFHCAPYISSLKVEIPAGRGGTTLDFIMWSFDGIPNEAAKEQLKERAGSLMEKITERNDILFNTFQ